MIDWERIKKIGMIVGIAILTLFVVSCVAQGMV